MDRDNGRSATTLTVKLSGGFRPLGLQRSSGRLQSLLLRSRRQFKSNLCRIRIVSLSQNGRPTLALAHDSGREHLTRRRGGKTGRKTEGKQKGAPPEPRPSQREARPGQGAAGGEKEEQLGKAANCVLGFEQGHLHSAHWA